MGLLILYLALAICISFLCSVLEAVLLSITPSYIESLKEKGKYALSERLGKLKNEIDKPLAAILSFNTIAHTVGAAGVGAQAAKVFGDDYLGLVSAALTLLILIFSEIIPKTIGASYWRHLGKFTASTLKILIFLMYPLVLLSQGITKILSSNEKKSSISRDEVSAMADLGHKEGIFHEMESRMLKNMIRFRNITAEDIMTPRTVMVMVKDSHTIVHLYKNKDFSKFSRIPVFLENRDDISGYVHKHDVLTQMAEDNHDMKLVDIKRDILMISKEMRLPVLLDKFLESKEHIALATDRYGGVSGLLTMEDVMETLLGEEIMDEYDNVEDMQDYARQKWKRRALRLGIIEEKTAENKIDNTPEEVVQYGITGGQPPLSENTNDANGKEH
ncbi:CNNM domain-containing protein [Fulvivirga ligni]|uniref:CNNM domain-containing protein n=1 Tax=Fulvivirga ligni TaxID=2904246 RepID=UPI001F2B0697|nr:CNNM domain-containing protein [Fulvivirga ligni]UII22582.1 CNNM domain-containing protein [Fulvivirga ligni]